MDTKHLLVSKTFWFNVLALALTVADVLPPKYGVPVITIANVALRLLTTRPTTLIHKPDDSAPRQKGQGQS